MRDSSLQKLIWIGPLSENVSLRVRIACWAFLVSSSLLANSTATWETGDDHDDKRRNILPFEPIMEKAPNIMKKAPNIMKKAPNIMVFEPNITGKAPSIVVFEPNIMEKSTECNGVWTEYNKLCTPFHVKSIEYTAGGNERNKIYTTYNRIKYYKTVLAFHTDTDI